MNVNRIDDRNEGGNPSMQLLQRDDLLPLRSRLRLGTSLILLRRGDTVMPRFARLYASLAARPRGWRVFWN